MPLIEAKGSRVKTLNFQMLYDDAGNSFPTDNKRQRNQITQLEMVKDGKIYSIPCGWPTKAARSIPARTRPPRGVSAPGRLFVTGSFAERSPGPPPVAPVDERRGPSAGTLSRRRP